MSQSFDFNDRENILLKTAVRYIDNFSLEQIVTMKLQENLTGFGHIHVFDFEIDPTVSHIFNVWG